MTEYKNYNECSSPICSDSISIQIFSYPFCIDSGENVEISWKIENPNNVSLTVSDNRVEWFVNNAGGEKGSTESLNNSELYFAQLGKINNIGTLFFKIRTKINGSFYESNTEQIKINESSCTLTSEISSLNYNRTDCIMKEALAGIGNSYEVYQTPSSQLPYIIFRYDSFTTSSEFVVMNAKTREVLYDSGLVETDGWAFSKVTNDFEGIVISIVTNDSFHWRYYMECSS